MSEESLKTRVIVGVNSIFGSPAKFTMAYKPETDKNGDIMTDQNGMVSRLLKLGGTKIGTEGFIISQAIRVPRSFLDGYEKNTSMGVDLVEIIQVELPEYQQVAWFPVKELKIVGD